MKTETFNDLDKSGVWANKHWSEKRAHPIVHNYGECLKMSVKVFNFWTGVYKNQMVNMAKAFQRRSFDD
jgi:hypothetical protein